MAAIGGSIESISLAGRTFSVTADSDTQRKIGGFENDVQANGDGTARTIKTRVPWSVTGITIKIDDDNGDQEFLQNLTDSNNDIAVAVTYPSGAVYQGTGQITGEVQYGNSGASASLDLMGPGILTKQ